jgi:hypothetical protein
LYKKGVQSYLNAWKYFAGPCYKLIPSKLIGSNRFNPSFSVGEDTLFMYEISKNFSKINFAEPEALYYRRVRLDSAMTQKRDSKLVVKNEFRLLSHILMAYIPSIRRYNFKFTMLNILSVAHGIIKA